MAHDVFICYATEDRAAADSICQILEAQGIRCWLAPRNLKPGRDAREEILTAIEAASALLLVLSASANQSQQVQRQVEQAASNNIEIIPLRIEEILPSRELENFIGTRPWLDAFTPPLENHVHLLAKNLKESFPQAVHSSVPEPPPAPVSKKYWLIAFLAGLAIFMAAAFLLGRTMLAAVIAVNLRILDAFNTFVGSPFNIQAELAAKVAAPTKNPLLILATQGNYIYALAAVVAFPVSYLLLRLYRRAVLKSMRVRGRAAGDSPEAAEAPGPGPAESSAPLKIVTLQENDAFFLSPEEKARYHQAARLPWRAAVVYSLGGACYAALLAVAWIIADKSHLLSMRFLILFWLFSWPLFLTLVLVAASTTRVKLGLVLAYFCVYALLGAVTVAISPKFSFPQLFILWLIIIAFPSIPALAYMNRRVRAVGPLALTFLVIAFLGLQVTLTFFMYSPTALALNYSFSRPIVEFLRDLHLTRIADLITDHGFQLFGFLIFSALGWLLLQCLRSRYEHKKISDQSFLLDSLWLFLTIFFCFRQFVLFAGAFWVLAPLVAFLVFKIVLALGFSWFKVPATGPGVKLLLLRVFALGKRSERLFSSLAKHWRYLGPIQMIAGPDLATATVEPHEFLEFLSGKLARRFIANREVLEQRLAEMDLQPDRDWRYRINDFFCFDDTWQMVLRRLASQTDAVLMDLRSFSRDRSGCIFEINELINTISLNRTVFIVDATTDEFFLRQTIQQAWTNLRPNSPNFASPDPQPRLFHYSGTKSQDQLLRALCAAPGPAVTGQPLSTSAEDAALGDQKKSPEMPLPIPQPLTTESGLSRKSPLPRFLTLLSFLVVLGIPGVIWWQWHQSWDPQTYYQRGIIYSQQNQFDLAIADFSKVIELNPKDEKAYHNRGFLYGRKSQHDLAIADISKAIALNSKNEKAYFNRGISYFRKRHLDPAIADFSKAIELNPKNEEAYFSRGILYDQKRQFDLAIADFNKAIALNPNYEKAYLYRAIANFGKAIELNPKNEKAYFNRGQLYVKRQHLDPAIADFSKVIDLNPKDEKAYFIRGILYNRKRLYDLAIADFNKVIALIPKDEKPYLYRDIANFGKAIELNPKNEKAYFSRGQLYVKGQHLDPAIADFSKVIELNRKDEKAYLNRGILYARKRHYDLAIADFSTVIGLNPKDEWAYNNRGYVYGQKNQQDLAIADLSKAIELNPKNAKAYFNRGELYIKKQQQDLAIADISKAIELNPKNAKAYFSRGQLYVKGQHLDLAIADFSKVIELNPKDEKAYLNRGFLYGRKSQHDLAIADFSKVIELNPKDQEAYFFRGLWYGIKGQQDLAIADFNKALDSSSTVVKK